jgi:hypothetical protein
MNNDPENIAANINADAIELAYFVRLCERLCDGLRCPGCGALPVRVYRRRPERGFELIAAQLFQTPRCGVLMCRACAYLLIVPQGLDEPVDPWGKLLDDLMRCEMAPFIAMRQKHVRLGVAMPRSVHIDLTTATRAG